MKISPEIKQDIKDIVTAGGGEYLTSHVSAGIALGPFIHEEAFLVNIKDQAVHAKDALELSYFFKQLAKKLGG